VVRARFRAILSAPTSRIVRFTTFMSSPPAIPARFTSLTAGFQRRTAGPTPFRCRRPGVECVYLWGKRVLPASGSTGRTGCSIRTAEGSTCRVTHRGCAAAREDRGRAMLDCNAKRPRSSGACLGHHRRLSAARMRKQQSSERVRHERRRTRQLGKLGQRKQLRGHSRR
jgi:hypothetical protein